MGRRQSLVLSFLLAIWGFSAWAEINQKAYRHEQHRIFIAAYDNLILKLNAFADAYESGRGFPSREARDVRKAWKKLVSAEPWFRESNASPAADRGCPTGSEASRILRRNYVAFIGALNQFLERYVANHASVFPADDVAAVRRSWGCLVKSLPAFGG